VSRPAKILATIAASVAGLVVVVVIAAFIVLHTSWFSNYVRHKIASLVEESTGARVDIGGFQMDWTSLTIHIRDFIVHGTEPPGSAPLLHVSLITLHLKLFSGIAHVLDIAYVGVQQPQVDLIVFPDGNTNIPQPKIQKTTSKSGNSLQTVLDLKIGKFDVENGLIQVAEEKSAFNARGENLRALLNYDGMTPSYRGELSIDALQLASRGRPPLDARVSVPVTIEANSIAIANAQVKTSQSSLTLNASVENLNLPSIQASVNANISLPEVKRSFNMPIEPNAGGAPKILTVEFAGGINEQAKSIQVQTAHLSLGDTFLQASGSLNGPNHGAIRFTGNLALDQLSRLMNASTQASGAITMNGDVSLDAHDNYALNGVIRSGNVGFSNPSARISDVSLYAPFHADPYLVDVNQLQIHALGGELTAKLFIEQMQRLSLESRLRNFDLPVIAAVVSGKHIGYDGIIDGSLLARGDLKAKGAAGFDAQANLAVLPGHHGVPLSGRLAGSYSGAAGTIEIDHSYLALPHSRLDISGMLNQSASAGQRIDLSLISHNLSDFLPVMNTASSRKPAGSPPVTLRKGGSAVIQAQITGTLSAPHITSHAALTAFDVQSHPFHQLALDLVASPSQAAIRNGIVQGSTLNGSFDASIRLVHWKPEAYSPLAANVTLRDSNIADLMAMAGENSMQASGVLNADAHIHGSYGNPLGSATLSIVNGNIDRQPFDRIYANVDLEDRLVALAPLEVTIGAARFNVSGTFRHPIDSFSTGTAQFQASASNLQLANLEYVRQQSRGIAGLIQLKAAATASVAKPHGATQVNISDISADLSATGLQLEHQNAGDLIASARTSNGSVHYQLTSNFAGSDINVHGITGLGGNYYTVADASIQNLAVGKTLEIAGQSSIPVRGTLSASAHVDGTIQSPKANLSFALVRANLYQQRINSLRGSLQYSDTLVNIPSIALDAAAGTISVSGTFSHPANDYKAGWVKLAVKTSEIQLARIEKLAEQEPGVGGTVHVNADLAASFGEHNAARSIRISELNADASALGLRLEQRDLGNAKFSAHTAGTRLTFALDSDIAQSQIRGAGEATLTGNYPLRANLSFANIKYSNIYPYISSEPGTKPPFEALIAGQASVNGPAMLPERLAGELRLTTLAVETLPQPSPTGAPARRTVALRNSGPILVTGNHEVLRVEQCRITGPQTEITAAGAVDLRNASSPLKLNLNANANLAVLQDIDSEFYSNGALTLQATIHGTPSQPAVNGEVQLKNANIEYEGSPNGISNANAVILLRGTTAEIQTFTGETGGGQVTLAGFASYTGRAAVFNLTARARRVRVLYSGISIVSSAAITLTGNTKHSMLGGRVVIDRIAYSSGTDAGSLLSSASAPPSSPSAPSPIAAGMRLDIHVLNSPGLRVISNYTQSLDVFADLTVRGTAADPGILGMIRITNGTLVFFGNKYTVNVGTINFYNPYAIEPVIDISLQTIVQSVSVTLGVSGTMDNLHLSYHSDPPLTFEQIVELLATNTTPSTDPTIAANQPPNQPQSFSQMGESAILSQAVANPVASRLQRVFGISEFKIDPSFQGSNGLPTARITLKQQITSNITFTYIEDLSQTNDEIIRVDWAFTSKFSAVATRDWNGVVGLEFLYAFKRR
jgi:translocation and assembly module TamB